MANPAGRTVFKKRNLLKDLPLVLSDGKMQTVSKNYRLIAM